MAGSPGATGPQDRVNEPLVLGKAGDVLGVVGGTLGDLGARTTAQPVAVRIPIYQVWASASAEWSVLASVEAERAGDWLMLSSVAAETLTRWATREGVRLSIGADFAVRASLAADLETGWGENREARFEDLLLLGL